VGAVDDERALVSRMRAGEEAAFAALLARYDGALRAMAGTFLRTPASVDDVVQETWLAVIRGVDRFEGRSALSTWIFSILMNKARTRAAGDARQVPFSALADADAPAVDPEAFGPDGRWRSAPLRLGGDPEASALSAELRDELLGAVEELPEAQRAVITLRDIVGFDAPAVCALLEITEANQRVLLHRARARLRVALAPLREVNA
jgi:RNA polymerase sigma-70 factor (ECF subfamily)